MSKGAGRRQNVILATLVLVVAWLELIRVRLSSLQARSAADALAAGNHLSAISDQLHREAAQVRDRPLVPRLVPQLVVLVTAFSALLYAGFRFQPDDATLTPFGTQELMIDVGVKPADSNGIPLENSPTLSGLLWVEAHGGPLDGYDLSPAISLPDPDAETIRILMVISYDNLLPVGSNLSVSFDIPSQAEFQRCETTPGFTCEPAARTPTAARSARVLQISGKVMVESEDGGTDGIVVVADFKKIPGLAFTYSRTKAAIRQPTISVTGTEFLPPPGSIREDASPDDPYPYVDYPPTNVITQAIFESANDFEFSLTPGSVGTESGEFAPASVGGAKSAASTVPRATWAFQQPLMPTTYSPPHITGTNQKALDEDANDLFIAGIIFGIAGGAAVNALQLFVTGVRRRNKTAVQSG
ncbi:hypothetical protein [Mycolicibacterium sp. J2]|uniref:hypothetical protein n=1 Tax=Mycolicibacterium sp. J2 TaxID=2993511 RepID=UPI00224B5587|nr:hypothetical protein [Mycolicibacterium sp. J2]MCX2714125.1 hypothetical protein [Mycolicibacterium sp. J2]